MTTPAATVKEDIYVPVPATLVRSEQMTEQERFYDVRLDSGAALQHGPGQFVQVSVPGVGEAPISVSSSPDKTESFELVVRRAGRLTDYLHGMEANAKVGIRGPFGTTFPVNEVMKGRNLVFICGGIGLVPVRSAIQYVLNRPEAYGDITVLYGSKTPADRLFVDELEAWSRNTDVTFVETVDRADADWRGNVGVITTLIPKIDIEAEETVVVICGPPVMYKFVLVELFARNVPEANIYVSLERRMKCGIGKCGHCQINSKYTCLEGPVFPYPEVAELAEAL